MKLFKKLRYKKNIKLFCDNELSESEYSYIAKEFKRRVDFDNRDIISPSISEHENTMGAILYCIHRAIFKKDSLIIYSSENLTKSNLIFNTFLEFFHEHGEYDVTELNDISGAIVNRTLIIFNSLVNNKNCDLLISDRVVPGECEDIGQYLVFNLEGLKND